MDGGSLASLLVLLVSLPLFFGVSVVGAALGLWGKYAGPPWSAEQAPTAALRRLVSHYDRTALLVSVLRIALLVAAAVSLTSALLSQPWSHWIYVLLVSFVLLVAAAVVQGVSQEIGRRYSRSILLATAPVTLALEWALRPLLWMAERLGLFVLARQSPEDQTPAEGPAAGEEVSVEEVRQADPEARRMIQSILDLEEIAAREVMVPRVDVVAVEAATPLPEVAGFMAEEGHSRLPVFRENIDNVIGILYARDVLAAMTSGQDSMASLEQLARPAMFVPDGKPLDKLLAEMQEQRASIAVVVDEYGGTEGILTIEDVLEEIVGDIEDEFQHAEPAVAQLGEGTAVVDGRVRLDEFSEAFQVPVEGSEGLATLGGFISWKLGRIPQVGDSVALEGVALLVLSTARRRVRKVQVIRKG
ncbi:MAG: HlyC/CorC family transporter [Chloroflexi bacterium]|nr:HlyC/CorC family transporter [Chloroflexota bacterium]